MKSLYNKSKRAYVHQITDSEGKITVFRLNPGATLAVPENVADIWLKSDEIMEVGKEDKAKDEEIARLKAENEKLKADKEAKEIKKEPKDEEEKPVKKTRSKKSKK